MEAVNKYLSEWLGLEVEKWSTDLPEDNWIIITTRVDWQPHKDATQCGLLIDKAKDEGIKIEIYIDKHDSNVICELEGTRSRHVCDDYKRGFVNALYKLLTEKK